MTRTDRWTETAGTGKPPPNALGNFCVLQSLLTTKTMQPAARDSEVSVFDVFSYSCLVVKCVMSSPKSSASTLMETISSASPWG